MPYLIPPFPRNKKNEESYLSSLITLLKLIFHQY
nr:MAG TPA: hypothetical protein [Caudoviricetes sp.]